jgi:membrane protease subunit HflK
MMWGPRLAHGRRFECIPVAETEEGQILMPWSNQGGGWKGGGSGGGGGPWGSGPTGGGNQPDLEELLKRSQDRLKQVMPGSGIPGPLMVLAAAAAVALFCFFAFTFRVNPDELGVVMRFGQFTRQEPPGLHFRLPYPIEEVRLPKVTRQNIIEVGMRTGTASRGMNAGIRDIPEESLMLTGDENIVDVDFVVFWRIRDAAEYLFNIQNPETTVKEVAESAMREIVGQSNIQPILTEARQKTEAAVQKLMQDTLDGYNAGIRIDQVQLQKVDPPASVIDAFRDVQAARADQQRLQNEAFTYANRIVPEARGEAERTLQGAEGYKQQTVAEATGQASRFLKIYEEYLKAPEVTRRRMFLETMERVMAGTDKIILDNKNGQGVVPFLPLDQLQQQRKPQGNN